jgi:DNA-binding beta-propeller fold protein YncE
MITLDQPQDAHRDRRRMILIAALLFALFALAVGTFIVLINRGGAPRVPLPGALGGGSGAYSFDRTVVGSVPRPLDVALSPDGSKMYVAEGDGDMAVNVYDSKGKSLGQLTPPHTDQFTRQPQSIAVAPDGTVYVVERRMNQVMVYNADGSFRSAFMPPGFGSWAPTAVAVDKNGLIYVAEAYPEPGKERHRVYILHSDGSLVRWFGQMGTGASDLYYPLSIAIDGKGRIWVADITGVKVFNSDGVYQFRLPGDGDDGVTLPGGLTYSDNKMYVTDITNHRAIVFDVSGDAPKFIAQFGELGFDKGQMRYPAGIAISASKIYIANRENDRIDTWTS